jgi:hypothetical protein
MALRWSIAACGTSGLFGGRRVDLPVADNSLILFVPVFAVALVVFALGAALAEATLVAVFLVLMFFSP